MRNERRTATDVELPIHVSRADACSPTQGALYALLVEAKRFGESADVALEDLLTDLCEPVRRFAVFRLRYHEDPGDMAEDVVQETLIRVAKAIRTCNAASDAQILAWVRTIARNAMTDMYRSPTTGMAAKLMAQDYHDEMKESANDWQNLAAVPSSPARAYLLLAEADRGTRVGRDRCEVRDDDGRRETTFPTCAIGASARGRVACCRAS
jgi:RNA polymerase sigma factor (sigma-70 family)